MQQESHAPASVFRRVAAFLYDCLLLLAVFFIFTAIALVFNNGDAIEHLLYKLLLIPVAWSFFAWFWMNGGQTLGMRAWRIKLVNHDNTKIKLGTTVKRFLFGAVLFGITLLSAMLNKQKIALHDKLSATRVIVLEKNKKLK